MLATQIEPTPRFIVTLNVPATDGLIRVPLAITGKWARGTTTFAITRQDLESIVRNFRGRQNGEINVDYDHASEMPEVAAGGPVPSAGRIVRLDAPEAADGSRESGVGSRGKEDSRFQMQDFTISAPESRAPSPESRWLLYGWFEPTARARELLEQREYRFISPAIEWGAKSKRTGKSQGTTLTSVALTNRPFLEELPQIRLSDPAFQPVEDSTQLTLLSRQWAVGSRQPSPVSNPPPPGEGGPPKAGRVRARSGAEAPHSKGGTMKHVNLSAVDGRIHIMHEDFQDAYYLTQDDLRGCLGESALLAAETAPGAAITYAQARALLSEAEAHGKFVPAAELFRAQAEQALDEAVRAGKVLPRQRDDWRKIALSDLPTFRKLMGAQKAVVPLAPLGLAGTPPSDVQEQVKFLAEQRMRERHVTFGQALSEIGREQPDLVQQYRRAVSSHD